MEGAYLQEIEINIIDTVFRSYVIPGVVPGSFVYDFGVSGGYNRAC